VKGILALNLVSSPGSGKTSILETSLLNLKDEISLKVTFPQYVILHHPCHNGVGENDYDRVHAHDYDHECVLFHCIRILCTYFTP
jgi:hypothetical protein